MEPDHSLECKHTWCIMTIMWKRTQAQRCAEIYPSCEAGQERRQAPKCPLQFPAFRALLPPEHYGSSCQDQLEGPVRKGMHCGF